MNSRFRLPQYALELLHTRSSSSRAYHRAATHADALVKHGDEQSLPSITVRPQATSKHHKRYFQQHHAAANITRGTSKIITPQQTSRADFNYHRATASITHGAHHHHVLQSTRRRVHHLPLTTSVPTRVIQNMTNVPWPDSPCSLPMGPSVPCYSSLRFRATQHFAAPPTQSRHHLTGNPSLHA